jgi:hypothetical protein
VVSSLEEELDELNRFDELTGELLLEKSATGELLEELLLLLLGKTITSLLLLLGVLLVSMLLELLLERQS